MTFWNSIKVAFVALRLNALRSFLTMLGIIIGIASVIVMVAISSGAQKEVDKMIGNLGTNMLIINPGAGRWGGRRSESGTDEPFSEKDLKSITQEFDFIEGSSGSIDAMATVVSGNRNWQSSINGVHADYPYVRGWVIEEGRCFDDREVRTAAKVAVVGQTIIDELFDGASPINEQIRINNVPFTIIGTLEEKGQAAWGGDQDNVILIPINTARQRVSGRTSRTVADEVGTMSFAIRSDADMEQSETDLEDFIRNLRKLAPEADNNFNVRNIAEMIRTRTETANTLGMLLAATAAISLVVGGIGIMNIMLVSVTERTKEIGLRLAVGARQRDILSQFLIEAVTLCFIGSLFGVAFGVGTAKFIGALTQWPISISLTATLIAIAAAAFIGIFFGYYPARKASRLDPIDALRYE